MAANAADLFRKGTSNFSTTLGGGISDSDTTIPLSSATGLPTDTAVTLTMDRVDANGVSTPAAMERVTGVVSGTNLVDCLRGEDNSTAAAHNAGAVVEMIWDGETWNDTVDALLEEHSQDGTHSDVTLDNLQVNDTSKDHQYVLAVNELTADRTVTLPLLTANDTFVFRNHNNVAINFNTPEGFLINGKIVPSVASDNLTVAIKGNDGNDPSASNPVYCMIGGTLRAITAALSTTSPAGFNFYNAGSAGLATKEIDYFVYLGRVTADSSIAIGFSRIAHANLASEFAAGDVTLEKYIRWNSGDVVSGNVSEVVNIGRFAATLSAGAGYTWTVPTFTATNLIQRPVFRTRRILFVPQFTPAGGGTFTPGLRKGVYQVIDDRCFVFINTNAHTINGTVSSMAMTLPFLTADEASAGYPRDIIGFDQTGGLGIWGQSLTTGIRLALTTGNFTVTAGGGYLGIDFNYGI